MGTKADFFVGIEADTYLAMFYFRMLLQVGYGRNDFGNTSLVISSQQSLSVGHEQILALMVKQLRELRRRQYYIIFGTEHDVLTVIVFHLAGRHVLAAHVGTCIHVGDEAYRRQRFVRIGGKRSKQIAVLVQRDFLKTHRLQFFLQVAGKYHLSRRTGSDTRLFTRLGVEADILQKTFY